MQDSRNSTSYLDRADGALPILPNLSAYLVQDISVVWQRVAVLAVSSFAVEEVLIMLLDYRKLRSRDL